MRISLSKKLALAALASVGTLVATAGSAFAAVPKIDSGDTAWMITSSALVLMMTIPGLALFYGGMVRRKNVLATMAQSFGATCVITVLWMIVGYSIAFAVPKPMMVNVITQLMIFFVMMFSPVMFPSSQLLKLLERYS